MAEERPHTGFENMTPKEFKHLERDQRHAEKKGKSVVDASKVEALAEEHRYRAKHGVGLAGDIVGDVSKGLGGKSNPVGGIVNLVSKGLHEGAGKPHE